MAGALLPDASVHEDESYFVAHFMKTSGNKKGFNWQDFKNKYYDKIQVNSILQGYMCHIIMDAVWFQQIADKYIRVHPREVRQKYYQKAYEDYVDRSIDLCIEELTYISKKDCHTNPQDLYVKK